MKQRGFFDVDDRLKRVSELGDLLEAMMAIIDFEGFRPVLDEALKRSDGAWGGRPAFDPVIENWRREFNTIRPHSALGYRPPAPETIQPADPACAVWGL